MSRSIAKRIDAELEEFGISRVIDRSVANARPACEVRCACGERLKVSFQPNMPPEAIVKNFQAKGWKVTTVATECPACTKPKKGKEMPLSTKTDPKLQLPAAVIVPTAMSPADRMKIREFLDGHYDEKLGMLLDGFTDQTAAEKLGVPRKWVEDIREAAYGPIKTDPELADLRQRLGDLGADIGLLQKRFDLLTQRITSAEKRLGGAS